MDRSSKGIYGLMFPSGQSENSRSCVEITDLFLHSGASPRIRINVRLAVEKSILMFMLCNVNVYKGKIRGMRN